MSDVRATEAIPARTGTPPRTEGPFPHSQVSGQGPRHLGEEILNRIKQLDGVAIADSLVSVPGAIAFHLTQALANGPASAFVKDREFGHLHPENDSSLHLMARPESAEAFLSSGWAESHPEVDGLVLVYGPRTPDELEVVWEIVLDTYRYATGR